MFYLNLKKYLSKTSVLFFVIFLSFFVFRFTQIDRPYHQDEYKWPQYSQPEVYPPGSVPHPPLTEYFFKITNILFGENYYRMTPFILSFLSLILLCIFVQRRFDTKTALISGALFSLSFYAVLGSLTVDTDGAILPFFLMLSLNFYDLSINNLSLKNIYIPLLFIALFLGLMVKLSFILVIGALIIDFLILHKDKITKKYILYGIFTALLFVFIVIISLLISKYLFNGFSLEKGIKYWSTFLVGLNNRNFFQTAIQFIKAIFYLSPLLIFSSLASLYYRNQKLNIFYIFSVLGLIFYLVLFDFSIGALDRYLVFLVIPLCILSGYAIKNIFEIKDVVNKKIIGLSGVLIFIIYILQFINQYVPPLHPKTEWIGRIFSFKWNFLYPFFGGSGPLGF
jgi:4-amino-4-deoxy-L-arabinose transferase-like glycosyltransferase